MIAHTEHGELAVGQCFQVDGFFRGMRAGVFAGVVHEVEQDLFEQ